MILKDFLPNAAFKEYIRCYRIVHLEFDKSAEFPFKAYPPKPEECLLFYLKYREEIELIDCKKKEFHFSVALLGQQTSLTKRYAGKSFLNFQIVFQPTALFRLTGIPSHELTNKYVDAQSVFALDIYFFLEELQEAKSYDEMLIKADKFVERLIRKTRKEPHQLDAVSRLMVLHEANVSVDWLAKETNLCIKQFKRKFNERTGINPKTYTRIIRFNKAYNLKNAHPEWDWLKVAIECNYYDYQHLVKDYYHFTGLNPNQLHQLELTSPESRLGLAKELYQSRIKPL
jgi:AraC-like DNA-binding protein